MVQWTLAFTHALPLRLHTQGPTVTATQSRCNLLCVEVCTRWAYVHMFFSLRVCESASKGSMQIEIFPASLLSVCLKGLGYFHY